MSPVAMHRTSLALTIMLGLFMAMDIGMKLVLRPEVTQTMAVLGWPTDAGTARGLGLLLLGCTALYLWPRTSILGAIMLTGYLGGAVATHVRIGSPLFSHVLFGVYLGVIAWAALWLRSPALRALLPLQTLKEG
jgi:hypothetical protein